MLTFFQNLGFYVESAGADDGYSCVIKLNGGENLCRRRRGHNVVVINPLTGNMDSKVFDTYGSSDQVFQKFKNPNCLKVLQNSLFIKQTFNYYSSHEYFLVEIQKTIT